MLCHCPAWPSSPGASLWMPKGQLHPQKPAPRQGMGWGGGQGLPGLPFPSTDLCQWEPFMPHTRLALCVEGWSCLHEKRPCAGEQWAFPEALNLHWAPAAYTVLRWELGGWGEPEHLTKRDQISQMRRQWCPGLQGGGKTHLTGEGPVTGGPLKYHHQVIWGDRGHVRLVLRRCGEQREGSYHCSGLPPLPLSWWGCWWGNSPSAPPGPVTSSLYRWRHRGPLYREGRGPPRSPSGVSVTLLGLFLILSTNEDTVVLYTERAEGPAVT